VRRKAPNAALKDRLARLSKKAVGALTRRTLGLRKLADQLGRAGRTIIEGIVKA
jgi:hypothetical protein